MKVLVVEDDGTTRRILSRLLSSSFGAEVAEASNGVEALVYLEGDTPDLIVTSNLRDFPPDVVSPLGIEVIHPDQFLVAQWDLDQLVAVAAFKRMRARWKKPEATAEDFAAALERAGLPTTAQRLREAAELI